MQSSRLFFRCCLLAVVALTSTTLRAARPPAPETRDNPSSYSALRLIGRELGSENLGRVVEVSGREGVPQPFVWRVTLLPDRAGGDGLREIEVAGGRIVARRNISRISRPALGTVNAPMNLRDLNLDSSGAFTAADTQARKIRLSFDALNYTLRADPATGKPVWNVQLLGAEHDDLGTLLISATDGSVLSTTGRIAAAGGGSGVTPPPAVEPGGPPPQPSPPNVIVDTNDPRAGGGFLERSGRTLDKTGRQVERSLRHAGATVERFFRGHSDLDRD
ncbi:MAG: hypothetical protein JO117_04615 [Verrucomicrobia bacterium]|nr:hypothetical protein [Verrucomicrobiota bacterium]MBV9658906.1 hypothetical protein [Verrucomicrobiota bacterium]